MENVNKKNGMTVSQVSSAIISQISSTLDTSTAKASLARLENPLMKQWMFGK